MTFPGPNLSGMRQDMSGLIQDWGVSCLVRRRKQNRNAAGQITVALTTVGTETLWIQPIEVSRRDSGRIEGGILDRSTHYAFERFAGAEIQAADRITVSGESYEYDVISIATVQNHKHLYLQQVKRS